MRRILMFLLLIMAISFLPAFTAYAISDELLILAPNFDGGSPLVNRNSNVGLWTIVKPPYSTTTLNGFNDGIMYRYHATEGRTPASMQIYIPSDNTYRIYVRVKEFREIAARSVYMSINDGPIMVFGSRPDLTSAPDGIEANRNPLPDGMSVETLPTVSEGGVWYWDGAEDHHAPVTLTKGFHTITINNPTNGSPRIDAIIFKTEGETFSKPSYFDAYLEELKDVEAPVFNGEVTIGEIGDNSIGFSWDVYDEKSGIAVVEIYRNNNLVEVLEADESSYTDTGLSEGIDYNYKVRAIDRLGQYSEKTFNVSTTGTPDTEPPTWPAGAKITVNSVQTRSANISWTAAVDDRAVTQYDIYESSVQPENLLMSVSGGVTEAVVENLPMGTLTKLLIVAKDGASNAALSAIEVDITTRTEVKYLLRADNFRLPTPAGGWSVDNLETTGGANSIPGTIIRNTSVVGEQPIEATVFLPDDDTYYIWALGRDFSANSPGSRWFSIAVNDEFDSFRFASFGVDGWSWDKGFSRNLTSGWHKISVRPGGGHMRVSAVFITNDAGIVLNSASNANYATLLAPLEDKVAPVMGNITAVSNTDDSIDLSWTAAVDSGMGVKGYNIYVNNSRVETLSKTAEAFRLEGLNATQVLDIKLEAMDAYGNRSDIQISKSVSYFETTKFIIADSEGNQANSLSALSSGGKACAIISLTNRSDSSKPILLGIAIYEKSTGRMVASNRISANVEVGSTINDFKAEVTLPSGFASLPENYYVYAALWNDAVNMAPQEEGRLLEN